LKPSAPTIEAEVARLRRRIERERAIRRQTEAIAERSTRALYEKQQEVVLLQVIAVAANEASTSAEALQVALDQVCAYTGWPVVSGIFQTQNGSRSSVESRM